MRLPLAHIRVLDLTRVRAGPTCVRQLADWGADVIKIEQPGQGDGQMGDARLGPDFQNLHRNKRAITLNLKSPAGKEVFMRLAKDTDVVVEKADRKAHPHAKPVGLQAALMSAVSNEGDFVIDPAAGSFTVLEAARQCGRTFLGCDIEG